MSPTQIPPTEYRKWGSLLHRDWKLCGIATSFVKFSWAFMSTDAVPCLPCEQLLKRHNSRGKEQWEQLASCSLELGSFCVLFLLVLAYFLITRKPGNRGGIMCLLKL